MKRLRKLTWLGVGLMVLALSLALYSSIAALDYFTLYQMAYYLSIFGVVLMAFAGFISRPRFFWLVAIVVGIAYIASLYGWLGDNDAGFTGVIMVLIPGLVSIMLGVLINRTSGRRKKA